jgi:hypothetical protein
LSYQHILERLEYAVNEDCETLAEWWLQCVPGGHLSRDPGFASSCLLDFEHVVSLSLNWV